MNSKNWIRTLVLVAVITWPGYHMYQYRVAKHQVVASAKLKDSVSDKLAAARVKYAQAKVASQTEQQ